MLALKYFKDQVASPLPFKKNKKSSWHLIQDVLSALGYLCFPALSQLEVFKLTNHNRMLPFPAQTLNGLALNDESIEMTNPVWRSVNSFSALKFCYSKCGKILHEYSKSRSGQCYVMRKSKELCLYAAVMYVALSIQSSFSIQSLL